MVLCRDCAQLNPGTKICQCFGEIHTSTIESDSACLNFSPLVEPAQLPLPLSGVEGKKFDEEKMRTDLLPVDALELMAMVLTEGAKKYGDRNWEKGMSWSRLYGACLRHLFAWHKGYDEDEETGLPHLAHAMCCIAFLLAYQLREIGKDDRP